MQLLVLRHGPAGDKEAWKRRGRPDAERPLTPAGRRKTAKAVAGLKKQVPALDVIATSPLVRAAQTADLLAKEFKKARRLEWPELAPGGSPAPKIRALKASAAAVVGHEPGLSGLIGNLLGAPGTKILLKKAGAALLELPAKGPAELLWLAPPRMLRR